MPSLSRARSLTFNLKSRELAPLKGFYQAAAYHQNYIARHPSDYSGGSE
ncbi:hypothetical protein [Nostoc sp.]